MNSKQILTQLKWGRNKQYDNNNRKNILKESTVMNLTISSENVICITQFRVYKIIQRTNEPLFERGFFPQLPTITLSASSRDYLTKSHPLNPLHNSVVTINNLKEISFWEIWNGWPSGILPLLDALPTSWTVTNHFLTSTLHGVPGQDSAFAWPFKILLSCVWMYLLCVRNLKWSISALI